MILAISLFHRWDMIHLHFDISFLLLVQEHFAKKGIHIVIVLCIGMGTHFRIKEDKSKLDGIVDTLGIRDEELDELDGRPNPHQMYRVRKDKTLSQVLTFLDKECGLETPIFVFGYMAIGRGISVRSNDRALTHLQIGLGSGQ